MPKSSNQKLKLIYLMKILLERTDETHSITMPEIIEALAAYDISAERKSLYNDIENLRVYGLDVIGTQEDGTYSPNVQHGVLTLIGAGYGADGKSAAGLMSLADKQKLDSIDPEKLSLIHI